MFLKPISVLTSIDPLLRDTTILSTLLDAPNTLVLSLDFIPEQSQIKHTVYDASGVIETEANFLEHACISCAIREDAVPTLRRYSFDPRWERIVLALPAAADGIAVCHSLSHYLKPNTGLSHLRLASVVSLIDPATAVEDLLGIDSCAERGIHYSDEDERAVGEVLAAQLAHADLIVTCTEGSSSTFSPSDSDSFNQGKELIAHLSAEDSRLISCITDLTISDLFSGVHDYQQAEQRCNPALAKAKQVAEKSVWSIELSSSFPIHPERLLEKIEDLGTGRVRARGIFWVANRPNQVCHWDGAGGQLYLGSLGEWNHQKPVTRLVFTGVDPTERSRLKRAFSEVLVKEWEFQDPKTMAAIPDALADWLD